jgi:phosphopantetheine adenylyltransferase
MLLSVVVLVVSALCSAVAQLQVAAGCRNVPIAMQKIVVRTTADVEELSRLAQCSNAHLRAVVHGTVALRAPVSVATNTTLTIAAADAAKESILDGMGTIQLFEVHGTLNILNMTLQNGFAEAGGAIYAAATSRVAVLSSKLVRNRARFGGAVLSDKDAVLTLEKVSCVQHILCADCSI